MSTPKCGRPKLRRKPAPKPQPVETPRPIPTDLARLLLRRLALEREAEALEAAIKHARQTRQDGAGRAHVGEGIPKGGSEP